MPLLIIIIFGILSSCFALVFELVALSLSSFSGQPLALSLFAFGETFSLATAFSLLGLALIEETSKYLFLRQYALRYLKDSLASLRGALLLGILFGLGFSSLEIALTVSAGEAASFFAPAGIAVIHILTSLGFAAYLFHFSPRRPFFAPFLILAATFLHALYNMAVFLFS